MDRYDDKRTPARKPRLLLHSCCGPCSTTAAERMTRDYDVTLFFYNPNISDPAEYARRRAAQLAFAEAFNRAAPPDARLAFAEGLYEPALFERTVAGTEDEPEGGARCALCFRLRLDKTAEAAEAGGFDAFTTTLTVSPHKDAVRISAIGEEAARGRETRYIAENFKKRGGFARSVELSALYGLYRQRSCGCRFAETPARREANPRHAAAR